MLSKRTSLVLPAWVRAERHLGGHRFRCETGGAHYFPIPVISSLSLCLSS